MATLRILRKVSTRGGAQHNVGEVVTLDDREAGRWVTAGWAEPVSRTAAAPAGKAAGTGEAKHLSGPPVDKMQNTSSGVTKGRRTP